MARGCARCINYVTLFILLIGSLFFNLIKKSAEDIEVGNFPRTNSWEVAELRLEAGSP